MVLELPRRRDLRGDVARRKMPGIRLRDRIDDERQLAEHIVVLALLELVSTLGLPVHRNEAQSRHREAPVHQDAVDEVRVADLLPDFLEPLRRDEIRDHPFLGEAADHQVALLVRLDGGDGEEQIRLS